MACVGVHISRRLKKELVWAADRQLQVISNKMLFKTVVPLRNLKNKAVLNINNIVCVAMWSLVIYSNCLVIY